MLTPRLFHYVYSRAKNFAKEGMEKRVLRYFLKDFQVLQGTSFYKDT